MKYFFLKILETMRYFLVHCNKNLIELYFTNDTLLNFFFYFFQRTMAVNDQEDSDFEGSGDTGSGYGDNGESFTKLSNLQ